MDSVHEQEHNRKKVQRVLLTKDTNKFQRIEGA